MRTATVLGWQKNKIWVEKQEDKKIKVLLRSRATSEQFQGYLLQRIQRLVFIDKMLVSMGEGWSREQISLTPKQNNPK